MVENIKLIFYIIPILGVVIKVVDDLFIEVVKSKYNSIPGKMGAYSRIISFGGKLIIAIEVVAIGIFFINYFCRGRTIDNSSGEIITSTAWNGWISFIGYIFAFLLVSNMVMILSLFPKIKEQFIYVLENNELKDVNEYTGIKKYFKGIKGIRLAIAINGGLSYLNLAIYTMFLIAFYFSAKGDSEKLTASIYSISMVTIYVSFCILAAILSNSLKKAISDLMKENEYIFSCNNGQEYIKTKLYLDYKDDYLVIKNGYELWLPKGNTTRRIVKLKKTIT